MHNAEERSRFSKYQTKEQKDSELKAQYIDKKRKLIINKIK
jgi:hypothetical protein